MTNSTDALTMLLYIMVAIMVCLLMVLAFVYINMKLKTNKKDNDQIEMKKSEQGKNTKVKNYTISSVFDFMEFDKIEHLRDILNMHLK